MVLTNLNVKKTNTTLYEECEILKPKNKATIGIADEVRPWNFHEDDPGLFDIRYLCCRWRGMFGWHLECQESETSDRSDTESENTTKQSDTSGMPLFEGACLTLDVSMLLVITFAMRHTITGVALADLLLLIEVHLISPNCFGHFHEVAAWFFQEVEEPHWVPLLLLVLLWVQKDMVQKDTRNTAQTNIASKISQRKVPLPTLLLFLSLPSYSPF